MIYAPGINERQDHYEGLTSEWTTGVIHCSEVCTSVVHRWMDINDSLSRFFESDRRRQPTNHHHGVYVQITARLLVHVMGISAELVKALPFDQVRSKYTA